MNADAALGISNRRAERTVRRALMVAANCERCIREQAESGARGFVYRMPCYELGVPAAEAGAVLQALSAVLRARGFFTCSAEGGLFVAWDVSGIAGALGAVGGASAAVTGEPPPP